MQAAQRAFMADLWRDSVGFMGAVMIRRMVGIAHVAEMKSIRDADVRWVEHGQALLLLGRHNDRWGPLGMHIRLVHASTRLQ